MLYLLLFSGVLVLANLQTQTPQSQTINSATSSADSQSPDSSRAENKAAKSEARRLYHAGEKYGHSGFFLQAAQAFKQAVNLRPDYGDAHIGLGHAYFDLGRWDEAIESLERGLALKPKDKQAQSLLAEAKSAKQRETVGLKGNASEPVGVKIVMTMPATNPTAVSPKPGSNETSLTSVYRVGPGDVLDVRVSERPPDSSTLFTITSAGLLEHPNLAKPLDVAGLTVDEISLALAADLKRQALGENPKVLVAVRDYQSHTILVSGLVKEPGTKILRREAIPLYVVVADAQPLPEATRATVVRSESHEVFVAELADPHQMNALVHRGDVITLQVTPPEFFYVGGEVKSPGEKSFRRGMTLTQAIIAAGGSLRKPKEARVARDNGKGFLTVTTFKLKDIDAGILPDPPVQAGDRITITH